MYFLPKPNLISITALSQHYGSIYSADSALNLIININCIEHPTLYEKEKMLPNSDVTMGGKNMTLPKKQNIISGNFPLGSKHRISVVHTKKEIWATEVPRGRGETLLTLQICSEGKMMQQLSDPVCLLLKPQRDRNKLWNKTHTEPAAPQRLNPNSTFITLRPNCLRPGYALIVQVLLCDVFNSWACAAVFGGSSGSPGLLDRGENEGRSHWGGKYQTWKSV